MTDRDIALLLGSMFNVLVLIPATVFFGVRALGLHNGTVAHDMSFGMLCLTCFVVWFAFAVVQTVRTIVFLIFRRSHVTLRTAAYTAVAVTMGIACALTLALAEHPLSAAAEPLLATVAAFCCLAHSTICVDILSRVWRRTRPIESA